MLISYLLIATIIVLFLLTFSGRNAKKRAGFKVLTVTTIAFSSLILFDPELLNKVARFFGVGRGVDFVNYLFMIVVAFLLARFYLESKDQDDRITKIARELSILKAKNGEDKWK